MDRSNKFPRQTLLLLCETICLLIFLTPIMAQAATYYVATTGSDSNPGTSAHPWRNPQKCVDSGAPLVKGDTCLIGTGTYTDTDGNGIVIYIRKTAPLGTESEPITIKSESPLGAVLSVPSTSASNAGIHVARSYYVIEGFDISGGASPFASTAGIRVSNAAAGITIRKNSIHGQGLGVCSDSANAFAGLSIFPTSNVMIEHNRIYQIGRLRNGEEGCTTNKFQHDHGIYSTGASNLTIQRNVFYDITRGYPVTIYRSGGNTYTHKNVLIRHNTISGKSPTGAPPGQISLCNTLQNIQIQNNIFHDPPLGYVVHYCSSQPIASGVVLTHNLTDGHRSDLQNPNNKPSSGVTSNNNKINTNPGFKDEGGWNYTLLSMSPAINAGIKIGLPYKGSAPDIGAYEFSEQDDENLRRPTGLLIQ